MSLNAACTFFCNCRRTRGPLHAPGLAAEHVRREQRLGFLACPPLTRDVGSFCLHYRPGRCKRKPVLLPASPYHYSAALTLSSSLWNDDSFSPPSLSSADDFLPYVMYGLPTHICGWIMHSMTTTSLLRAVGVADPGTAAVAATSAAIKWLSKDGLGALGRLLVGSRLGVAPDVDPKLMRMYAELIALVGSALELSTGFYPQFFLYSAGMASALRTVGKGISSPAHTAFRLHFARDNNIGAVCAKEEVFEVMAELCGLATSVLILQSGVTVRSAGSAFPSLSRSSVLVPWWQSSLCVSPAAELLAEAWRHFVPT